jgi:hypothetical protein
VAVVRGGNLALRFLLEVAALAALGYAGWVLGPSTAVSVVLVVVLPALTGQGVWAWALVSAVALNEAALFAWDQRAF